MHMSFSYSSQVNIMQLKEVNYNMGNVFWKEVIVKSLGVVVDNLFEQEPSIQSSVGLFFFFLLLGRLMLNAGC